MAVTEHTNNQQSRPAGWQHLAPAIGLNLLLWLTWGWLYWPLSDYFAIIFTRQEFRTNQFLLIGILILLGRQLLTHYRSSTNQHLTPISHHPFPYSLFPTLRPAPLALALGGSAAFLLVERFLDVHTLAATLFGLATYGLLGLYLTPIRWRRGLPAALLLIGTLPFGAHLQTFVGYPMRIATAALVRDGLAAAGIGTIGVDTILIFENGVAHVDLPCSGVQSLWTGALFLLAASWIERRPFNLRWLGVAAIFAILLFVANLLRVAVLITVGEVFGLRLLAEMLHVPLGILGFAGACAAAVGLLRMVHDPPPPAGKAISSAEKKMRPLGLIALTATVAVMALLYTPRPQTGLQGQSTAVWRFPTELQVEPLPLKPDELLWLTRDGAEAADRYRFTWRGRSGSMILITSRTWRAHHRPERCFEVYGLNLDSSQTRLIGDQQPLKWVQLSRNQPPAHYTAGYWFQSASQLTDDYATRIWADLAPQRERWVLVSFIFDEPLDADDPDLQGFVLLLQNAVDTQLRIENY